MSKALRKITGSLSKSKTMVIFINQLRMKVGTSMIYGSLSRVAYYSNEYYSVFPPAWAYTLLHMTRT